MLFRLNYTALTRNPQTSVTNPPSRVKFITTHLRIQWKSQEESSLVVIQASWLGGFILLLWCMTNCMLLLKTQPFHMTIAGFEASEGQQFYSGTRVGIIRSQALMTPAAKDRVIQDSS